MKSIRRQLNRTLILAIALIECVGLAATYWFLRDALTEQIDALLDTKVEAIGTVVAAQADGTVQVDFTGKFLRGFDEDEATDFFEIWDASGKVIARSDTLGHGDLPRRVRASKHPRHWSLRLPNGQLGRAAGVAFSPRWAGQAKADEAGGGPAPLLQLVVATNREELDEMLHRLLGIVVGVGILILGATAIIVPYALRRGLVPLDALAQQTGQIDAGSLDARFATEQLPEELLPITQRLNDLLARLQASFERERRVSADLAHELRTPLAELRMLAESALKWPEARDGGTDRETLAITQQMERIVRHMLTLARTESGQIELHREPVDLATLAEIAWRPFAARAAEKSLLVTFDLKPVPLVTDSALWRGMVTNLFDNAVEYTPAGGRVCIRSLVTEKEAGLFSVSNQVEGLQPSEVISFFERFWRKEKARSGGNHLGLGLSLVRSFSHALGWEASAELSGDHTLLTIELKPRKDVANGPSTRC